MDIDNRNFDNRLVIYTGADAEQVLYGGGTDPRDVSHVGGVYEVVDLDVRDWSSTVFLKGFTGWFNTVLFQEKPQIMDTITRNIEAEMSHILEGVDVENESVANRLRAVLNNLHDEIDHLRSQRRDLQGKLNNIERVLRGEHR